MKDKTEKLIKIAKRIAEISNEISELNSDREASLRYCHGSVDDSFNEQIQTVNYGNCLTTSFDWSKESREEARDEYGSCYGYDSFKDILHNYGCENCKGAYEAKIKISLLKQERGRLVGNITKIGKSL